MVFLPEDSRGNAGYLESMLKNFSASYKLYWFKGVFEEVLLGNMEISFSTIIHKMIVSAWYPVLYYNLSLGKSDQLANVITYIVQNKENEISKDAKPKEIFAFLSGCDDRELIRRVKKFEEMVPYRLIRPFFEEELSKMTNVKDYSVNGIIEALSNENKESFYSIDKGQKTIEVNPQWRDYLVNNETIIKGWLNYKLVDYLQRRNPSVPAISYKIFPPEKRDLKEASTIWEKVLRYSDLSDIYTRQKFTERNIELLGGVSIDHFVPWSFVLHDELWNLCPTFQNINSRKGNKIPPKELITDFCSLQYSAYISAREVGVSNKQLESYLTVKRDVFSIKKGEERGREVFENSIKDMITPLYQIAYNNGYEVWSFKDVLPKN